MEQKQTSRVILSTRGITKRFGGVLALSEVDFDLHEGEVHALMGENGAGKSTLGKIITGVYHQDEGDVIYDGEIVHFNNPKQAIQSGISMVMQEFNLLNDLDVAENIFINDTSYYSRLGVQNKQKMLRDTIASLKLFNLEQSISPTDRVTELSVAEKQIVEIIKAVSTNARVILLDEPTATLSPREVDVLFQVIRKLKKSGVSFVIVSHRINEIYEISDRMSVLRDGQMIISGVETGQLSETDLIKAMVGREVTDLYRTEAKHQTGLGETPILKVEKLCDLSGRVRDVSFTVRRGEILGISGLMGAGRSELIRCIFGIDKKASGQVFYDHQELKQNTIKESIANGMALVPEDRKTQGLILNLAIERNLCLAHQANTSGPMLSKIKDRQRANDLIKQLQIKAHDPTLPAANLSGGNQQKVLLAKWLSLKPTLLFVDEPTRGIDIAAKSEIYTILRELASNGVTIVIVSSEIPEILGICDRVLVMKDGRIVRELSVDETSEEEIGYYATIGTGAADDLST